MIAHALITLAALLPGQTEAQARKELLPRTVTIVGEGISLDKAVEMLQGTGNMVVDRRRERANPMLRLNLKDAAFWPSLDEIVRQAGCGYSVYQEDGKLALVDMPQRTARVSYAGICRLAVKRVSVTRDEDSGSHFCNVVVEVAWEPRFQPFFMEEGGLAATIGDNKSVKVDGHGKMPVAGHGAVELTLRLPAPPRVTTAIGMLEGKLTLVGPSKMLTFTFANLKPGQADKQVQEDVHVTLKPGPLKGKPWSFDVGIVNPPGGPTLESFQQTDWIGNNSIVLRKVQGNEQIAPTSSEDEVSAARASIRYHFERNLPANPAGWAIVYRTPGRIVDVTVAFALKDIPLP